MQPSELLDDYITVIGPKLRTALTATAVRNRSLDARVLLARAALGDEGTLDELITAARAGDRRWLARRRRRIDPGRVAAVAQTMALQDMLPTDRRDALALYELVRAACGPDALSPANQALHAQLTLAWEGPDRLPQLLSSYRAMKPAVRSALEVDLLNPFVEERPAEPWLAAFLALLPEPRPTLGGNVNLPPFDRLTPGPVTAAVEAAERVSVVVTAFRPDHGLITAVRSILAQTWRNVEVIIVDDGSPEEYDPVFDRALALGERIRLIKQPGNLGTYAARNTGLDAAAGEFVAFQDSDDWSHPRRLERQVAPLLAERRVAATTSDGLSVTEDLLLTRPGVRSGRFNPSSLVFRRALVMGRIGYFDRVRKAADSEYIGRIQAAFGPRSVRHVPEGPLALIRLSAHSLSRSEIRPHWMHPARVAYSSAYLRWHQSILAGTAPPFRPADGGDRPFAAPAHLLPAPARTYDVIVAADWRFLEGAQRAALDEIRVMLAAGLRVGVLQLESYRVVHLRRSPLCRPIQQMLNEDRIGLVPLAEECTPGLLIVRQPTVLQFARGETSGIRPRRAMIVADRAPVRGDGVDRRYVPSTCTAHARDLFEVDPVWCPQDDGVRQGLRDADPALGLIGDLPAVVSDEGWSQVRTGAGPGTPIVGTDLCDAGAWPADVPDALGVPRKLSGVDVRLRLPDRPPSETVAPSVPKSWLVFATSDIEARPFLHQLDFYLHFPHRRAGEMLSRPALEAAALGCVVVLPERFAARYGDAAVYGEPADAADVIRRYASDPSRYAEQSRRARAVVAAAHPPRAFLDLVESLLPAVATARP